jgi:dihydrofolate reductase
VASRTLREPLAWDNSRLIGDVAQEVPSLRDELGKDILVLGSGEVVRSLLENDLVDELRLSIVPLILGTGKRLFGEGVPTELKLAAVDPTTTGALLVTYRRAQGD